MNNNESRLVTLAFLLGAFLIFGGLGSLPLMVPDEGRNAEVAREMKESGSWLVPTYNGLPYLDKPAFYFKTVALSMSLFGENETGARFSSAVAGFLLLVITFLFARREYGTRTGAFAVMVVATSPLFLAFSRLVIFDMMLALFVCGAIFAGYRGFWRTSAVCAALATLVKGPVGFLIPVLVLAVYDFRLLKRIFAPVNLLIFFGLTLPWFFGVNHYHNDFAYYGLVEESFHRYTTTAFRRTGPWWYYGPWLLVGMLTWCLLLPESIVAAWRNRRHWSNADRLLIVWCIVVILFFSISKSKRPDYILSAIVALGILVARVMNRDAEAQTRRWSLALGGFCLIATGVVVWLALHPGKIGALRRVPGADVTHELLAVAAALAIGLVVAAIAWRRKHSGWTMAAYVGVPALVGTLGFAALRWYAESKSARALADAMPPLPADTIIAGMECFPTGFPFYRHQFVNVITDDGGEFTSNYIIFMLKKTKPWPAGVTHIDERDAWLAAQKQPVFLLSRRRNGSDIAGIAQARGATVTNLVTGWWGTLLLPEGR